MNNTAIYQTSFFGFSVAVYPDRLVYRPFFGLAGEKSTPIKSIAGVELAVPGVQLVTVETAGGDRINMVVPIGRKTKVRDAIYQAKAA